ncbi:ABC-type glycerol-3-phosphate transport system substrate-binding protein [Evansella vedderi]|uniref:ABC-type glycerol-3-phosphate transport system substrate-binding protein n=1 Tax=Evansella vedderi TaxID=38282 RepID=A0ABT9ZP01_9BACI|nr:ABC-type glycerol-3-phosphate transport system substrate-binding protein [Evansella vedderi]
MKKLFTLLTCFFTAIALLAACGETPESTEASKTKDENESEGVTSSEEEVTIRAWVMGTDEYWRSYHDDLVERFMEEYPGIKVELDYIPWGEGENQLITSAANNTLPDVSTIAGRWTAQMVAMNAVEPLDGYFDQEFAVEFVEAA